MWFPDIQVAQSIAGQNRLGSALLMKVELSQVEMGQVVETRNLGRKISWECATIYYYGTAFWNLTLQLRRDIVKIHNVFKNMF